MHIPDGFINGATSLGAGVLAAGGLGAGLRQAGKALQERHVPLAGLVGAFIFAMQMVNFPVGVGTSGHLIGGALAAVLVGPWVGIVVLSVVVIVQALLFADGGLSALGLNITNMAIITTVIGWLTYRVGRALLARSYRSVVIASGLGAAVSVVAASLGFVAEYALGGSGGAPIGAVLAAMAGVHTLIGIGEGLITGAVIGAVLAARPDLVYGARDLDRPERVERRTVRRVGAFVAAGLGVALVVAAFVSPFASSDPDGLERVAIDQDFAETAQEPALESPLADYEVPGDSSPLSTSLAGAAGVLLTFGVGAVVLVRRKRRRDRHRQPVP